MHSGEQRLVRSCLVLAATVACGTPAARPSTSEVARTAAELSAGYRDVLAARDIDDRAVGPLPDGKRATAIVVFASWCGPCRRELALLGELSAEEPRLRVIGVNYYEEFAERSDEQRLRAYVTTHAPWLRVVRADEALMRSLGRPSMVPSVYVFDGKGRLVRAFLRARRAPPGKRELAAVIEQAIRKR